MKRTSSQALMASCKYIETMMATFGNHPLWAAPALLLALILCFFLGRESVSVPENFAIALAGLRLDILLQQHEISRLSQINSGNINALAARLAELQAASTRIDALGERLVQMGQLSLDEFDFTQVAAVGGPADPEALVAVDEDELRTSLDALGEKLHWQASQLDALQFLMVNREVESDLTPAGWPLRKGWISSRYGERNDPFTGKRARHQGVDFVGKRGSDVLSVASGVVVWAANLSGYGRTVEIDHGNGYLTRYAHNDSLEVVPGTQVTAGQVIAKLGSTGRTSTPHVHFEVLQNGVNINPAKFVETLR